MFRSKSKEKARLRKLKQQEEERRRKEAARTLKITPAQHRSAAHELPNVLRHLRRTGPHPRSLFAASVSQDEVRQAVDGILESKASAGGPSLAQVCSRYPALTWAAAVKAILREAPQPLVPSATSASLLDVAGQAGPEKSARVAYLREILEDLPHSRWATLSQLCALLREVAGAGAGAAFAGTFGTLVLLPHLDDDTQDRVAAEHLMAHVSMVKVVMELMIDFAPDIFARAGDDTFVAMHSPATPKGLTLKRGMTVDPHELQADIAASFHDSGGEEEEEEEEEECAFHEEGDFEPSSAEAGEGARVLARAIYDFEPAGVGGG